MKNLMHIAVSAIVSEILKNFISHYLWVMGLILTYQVTFYVKCISDN